MKLRGRIMGCDNSLGIKEFLNQLNFLLYLHMFIFPTNQEVWARELMTRIMRFDDSLG
jgi:hypothetical protein